MGLLVVVTFLFFQFAYFPMKDELDRLELSVKSKEKDLSELKTIVAQYKRLERTKANHKGKTRGENFDLFSVIETLATKTGLKDKIDYMKPGDLQLDGLKQEKWVDVKFSGITLKEFTDYLYNLRSFGGGIYIKRLSTRKEGKYLNLILQPAVIEIK